MNELDTAVAPAHQPDEAPISTELRDRASENLNTIKRMIEEARAAGTLSEQDQKDLRDWLEQDVQSLVHEADQHDAERQAILASTAVNKAVEGVHVGEDYTVSTPTEHQAELAHRQEHGHSSNETATRV